MGRTRGQKERREITEKRRDQETSKLQKTRKSNSYIRWEDCLKRDLRKAEDEEQWRETSRNGRKQQ